MLILGELEKRSFHHQLIVVFTRSLSQITQQVESEQIAKRQKCFLWHDTHRKYIPSYAIEDQLSMVVNWLCGRCSSSGWYVRSSSDAKIAVDFDITDNQVRVDNSRVSV